jgi:ubiquinone/menaquinone biosynthesis C-methylase UbiE
MRRQVIPPIARHLRGGSGVRRVLDLGAGTGRTLSQLGRAVPDAKYFALDLSPHYLRHAARVLRDVRDVSFIVDNAERTPFRDDELDVVTSTFVLHELPLRARQRTVREAFRVLKRGGRLVLLDSAQLGDAAELRVFLENFAASMNEPFFPSYLGEPLEALVESEGFVLRETAPCFLSKLVVAQKPVD